MKHDPQAHADRVRTLYPEYAETRPRDESGPGQPGIRLVGPDDEELPPSFADEAKQQHADALARGALDLSGAPTWFCPSLQKAVGPMLPGELHVVGAIPSNGKSAFLLTELDHLAKQRVPTLYFPLETGPVDMRREWAAWECGLDKRRVHRNQLDATERAALEGELARQMDDYAHIRFVKDPRVTTLRLRELVQRAVDEFGCRVAVIDHFHRLSFGEGNFRILVTEAVRVIRDLGREMSVVMLTAAQVAQSRDPLDRYLPPSLSRLKESGGIGEEANGVLMLSRLLGRRRVDYKLRKAVESGRTEKSLALPRVMRVTDRKHRIDDEALDTCLLLMVDNGKVREPHYGELEGLWQTARLHEEADAEAEKAGKQAGPVPVAEEPPPREPGEEDGQEGLPF